MDALELIKVDHQRILSLFNQVKAETGVQQIKLLVQNIRHDLGLLFYAKENVFYPAFKNYPHMVEITKASVEQQNEMKESIASISKMQEDGLDFQNCILELKNHVESYITSEEEEFFPLVHQEMKRPERERLGRHLQAVKQEREESVA
jgi:hemerythrin superfamily protein